MNYRISFKIIFPFFNCNSFVLFIYDYNVRVNNSRLNNQTDSKPDRRKDEHSGRTSQRERG